MSSKRSKEDRKIWENSEVMMELEKQVASNIDFVKKFADVGSQTQELEALQHQLDKTRLSYVGLGDTQTQVFSADDHVIVEDPEDPEDDYINDNLYWNFSTFTDSDGKYHIDLPNGYYDGFGTSKTGYQSDYYNGSVTIDDNSLEQNFILIELS